MGKTTTISYFPFLSEGYADENFKDCAQATEKFPIWRRPGARHHLA
jgi:hypothetical protein